MFTVAVNIVRYNHPWGVIRDCINSVLAQDVDGLSVTLMENGSADSIEKEIGPLLDQQPRLKYENNGKNLGFAGAHNLFIARSAAVIVVPLNPDTVMTPGYLRFLTESFVDPRVGAATGKMVRPQHSDDGLPILDGTGIVMSKARRGRERGQNEIDRNQFDSSLYVFGVSGTASAYRKSALEKVRLGEHEYFDEDFFAYWEDLDLSWRLRLAGFECLYVPQAVIYHSRVAGQSKGGYRRPIEFIRHHRKLPERIRRWNWKNQLFCIVKNDFGPGFWRSCLSVTGRQLLMFGYIIAFEPGTLGAVPDLFRLLPKMLEKRKAIMRMRVVDSEEIAKWFV